MRDFLENIFGEELPADLRIVVFTTPAHRWQFFSDTSALRQYALVQSASQNLYFGLGLIQGTPQGRGKYEDIGGIGALWCDVDVHGPAHARTNLPASLEEAKALVERMPLPPSILVDSGHGLHAYWLLKEPWIFESEAERQAAQSLARRWHGQVCTLAATQGWALENLGDLTRVLRLPETLNHNGGGDAATVRVIESHPDRRYVVEDFEQFLLSDEASAPSVTEADSNQVSPVQSLILKPDVEPPSLKLLELASTSPLFWDTWNRKRTDLADSSQSGYDLSLATIAALSGWSDQEIADLIITARRLAGDKPQKALRENYLRRTIERARQAAAENVSTDEEVDLSRLLPALNNGQSAMLSVASPSPMEVTVGPKNDRQQRLVVFSHNGSEHRERIDVDNGFAREAAIRRAVARMGVMLSGGTLAELDRQLVAATAQEDLNVESPRFANLISAGELLAMDLSPQFLVRNVLVEGQPMIIGGRSKTLKTGFALDLALSIASGSEFLGKFSAEQAAVGIWSGESGAATIRETALRIAAAKGIDFASADLYFCFDLPRLSQADHLVELEHTIRDRGLRVAIFDPLYLALLTPETANAASNVFAMGSLLQGLTRLGKNTDCTIIVLHHFRKTGEIDDENPAALEQLAQSGVAEWARQWILLQRQSPYQGDGEHRLWMRCGGSAGHSSLWAVAISEGLIDPENFGGRKWEVSLVPAASARAEVQQHRALRKAAEQERREAEHRERLEAALQKFPDGETGRKLRIAARLNPTAFEQAIFGLIEAGKAETCTVEKKGGHYDAFRLTRETESECLV